MLRFNHFNLILQLMAHARFHCIFDRSLNKFIEAALFGLSHFLEIVPVALLQLFDLVKIFINFDTHSLDFVADVQRF